MKKTKVNFLLILATLSTVLTVQSCYAQPYGKGIYNENVPYGDATSLSISTNNNVSISITPTTSGTLSTGTSNVTVRSTDVKGYKLYIRALNNNYMDNLGAQLPASANTNPAPLAVNTWGYNTNGSNNFVGISAAEALTPDNLIRSTTTPVSSGETTNVTYGVKLDMAKPAGNYVAYVVYTAVPQTN